MKVIEITGNAARQAAVRFCLAAPDGNFVRISDATRTLEQNAAQWPWLEGFAQQVEIPINGEKMKVNNETWKEILTASFNGELMKFAVWNGRTILLPERTSKMGRRRFALWMDWLIAEATTNGVKPVFVNDYTDAE